jgi:TM2 domain-containing membrane protein YozV
MTTKVDEYERKNAASLVLLGWVLGFGVASCAQLCGGVPCRNLLTLLMVGSMVVVHILVVLTLRVSVLFYNRASRLDVIDIGFAFSSRLSWAHKHRTWVGFRANNSDRSISGVFHPIFGIFNFVGWNLHGYGDQPVLRAGYERSGGEIMLSSYHNLGVSLFSTRAKLGSCKIY